MAHVLKRQSLPAQTQSRCPRMQTVCVCMDTIRSDSCHSEVMLQQRSSGRRGNIISRGPGLIWLCNGKCSDQNWPPAAIVCLFSVVLVHECMRVRVCVSQRVPYLRARLTPIFMGFLPSLQPPPPPPPPHPGFAQIRSVVTPPLPGSDCAKLDR